MMPPFARTGTGTGQGTDGFMVAPPGEFTLGASARQSSSVVPPSLLRALGYGCLLGLLLTIALHGGYVLLGSNFHTVIAGSVYRCAQPTCATLERLVRTRGIRTVINLRGPCDPLVWYLAESRLTNRLNVSQEDLSFSAGRLPSVVTLRQLVEVLDHSEYPVLLHCHKGADRTGMASAITLLLQTDASIEDARRQVGFRYGHLSLSRTANIDRFFDLYEEWLAENGLPHSPAAFRRWIATAYCPGECRCGLEILNMGEQPSRLQLGIPTAVRVRCTNTSIKPWRLRPGSNAGIHLSYDLFDASDRIVAQGRSGLFHATVEPGEHIDLTVPLPGQWIPGSYELRLDMVDEQHAYFLQTGSQPLTWKLEVP
jgi:hypothetical protein